MSDKKKEKKPEADNGFDTNAFMKQKFTPREGEVDVKESALAEFFPQGVDSVWKVQSLTSDQIARCNEAGERYKKVEAMVKAMATDNAAEITEGVQKLLGTSTDVSVEVVKRQEHLIYGSVVPVITKQMAVRIADVAPLEFFAITTKILELTGLGQVAGKSKPSGKEQTSSPASSSQT